MPRASYCGDRGLAEPQEHGFDPFASANISFLDPSHQPESAEAGMPIARDDHVVLDRDAEQVANLDHLLGHVDIGPRWRWVTGRVVVHEHAAGGVQFYCFSQNLAWIHRRMIHRPLMHDLVSNQVVALVQEENPELLAGFERHCRCEIVDHELPSAERRSFEQEPSGYNAPYCAEEVEKFIVVELLRHRGAGFGEA